ncbi:acetyl-CoA hydrolase [Vibrio quintilis]|nr:acetyl-CoA hydrolase [Vibrio quintilis]
MIQITRRVSAFSHILLACTLLTGIHSFAATQNASDQPATTATPHRYEAFQPMRSFILVSVRDDSDLPAAYRWLYKYHVPDSISQFAPYVTKYATYRALPVPPEGKDYGTYNWIMTEHYWLINPFNTSNSAAPNGLAFKETFDPEYMRITRQPTDGDLRPTHWVGSREGYHPTVFAFAPLFWEEDYKGSDRTIEDGPNYRWLIVFKYPKGVTVEQGDKWFRQAFIPALAKRPEVNRILSSHILSQPHTSPFQRVAEIWFDNSKQWQKAMTAVSQSVAKPDWAVYDKFPYLEPYKDFVGEFLLDHPESDHLQQYQGYISTR